jgi:hypothetical protein
MNGAKSLRKVMITARRSITETMGLKLEGFHDVICYAYGYRSPPTAHSSL